MNEKDANWFKPLWRRVAVTAVVIVWFGFEALFTHEPMWMTISGIGIAYCVWTFFIRFPKDAASTTPAVPATPAAPAPDEGQPPPGAAAP